MEETLDDALRYAAWVNYSRFPWTHQGGVNDGWQEHIYPNGLGGVKYVSMDDNPYAFVTRLAKSGSGGGYFETPLIPVLKSNFRHRSKLVVAYAAPRRRFSLVMWSTEAKIRNIIQMVRYDENRNLLDTIDIYASGGKLADSPIEPSLICGLFPDFPSDTRYYSIRLIGGHPDGDVEGTTYFSEFRFVRQVVPCKRGYPTEGLRVTWPIDSLVGGCSLAETRRSASDYVNAGNAEIVFLIPMSVKEITSSKAFRIVNKAIYVSFSAEARMANEGETGNIRFRIGDSYSNEVTITGIDYVSRNFTIMLPVNTFPPYQLYMQLRSAGGEVVFGRKTVDTRVTVS